MMAFFLISDASGNHTVLDVLHPADANADGVQKPLASTRTFY
ncbi:MAG: hypothetical protein ACKOCK_07495 [Chloroflexota bacterium]